MHTIICPLESYIITLNILSKNIFMHEKLYENKCKKHVETLKTSSISEN